MCALAEMVLDGVEITDGLDLGIQGYHSIKFAEGSTTNLEGDDMLVITAETVNEYDF